MSGQESHPNAPIDYVNAIDNGMVSQADFEEFMKSQAASGLSKNSFSISRQQFYAHDGAHQLLGTNYGTSAGLDAFNAWKQQRDSANAQHNEYVKAMQESPGRSATILTQPGQNKPVTLIGG